MDRIWVDYEYRWVFTNINMPLGKWLETTILRTWSKLESAQMDCVLAGLTSKPAAAGADWWCGPYGKSFSVGQLGVDIKLAEGKARVVGLLRVVCIIRTVVRFSGADIISWGFGLGVIRWSSIKVLHARVVHIMVRNAVSFSIVSPTFTGLGNLRRHEAQPFSGLLGRGGRARHIYVSCSFVGCRHSDLQWERLIQGTQM